jgi:tetratricopeptide (TPR) repeat protein
MFCASIILIRTCIKVPPVLALLLCWCGTWVVDAQQLVPDCDEAVTFQSADQLIKTKQYDQASELLQRFEGCPGRKPLDNFQLAWLYGRARRFDDALRLFEAVPHDEPDPMTHDYAIALSKFELAQYQAAIDVLRPYQASGKTDDKSMNLLAVSYSKLGLYRNAYDVLIEQIHRSPADLTSYLNLITVCAEGGDVAKAGQIATQAKQLFPDSADAAIVLGAAETMLGHLDQAYADFSTGARLAPSRADARFFLALVDYKQGKYSDAIMVLQTALKAGIADSDLRYLMAECLLKQGSANLEEALKELDCAIDLNAKSVAARALRGKLLLESGRSKQAVADLELARQQDSQSRAALYNLARAYQAEGRTTEARALFQQLRSQSADALNEMTDTRLNDALTGKAGQKE